MRKKELICHKLQIESESWGLVTAVGLCTIMNEEDLFDEIERDEQSKRRAVAPSPSGFNLAVAGVCSVFQELRDGFSIPKNVSFKYAP